MLLKTSWMRYLTIGLINFLILLFVVSSCSDAKIDYVVKADFIYKNNTNHTIKLESSELIKPNGTLKIAIEGDGNKNITEASYVPPSPFGPDSIIKYDDLKCDVLKGGLKAGEGEGPSGIKNYKWKKVSERYYEFTYHFTEEDYNRATTCK